MANINKAFISGNLTRDADLRMTQGGMAILSIGVAVNDRRKNPQTGQWEDVPNYIDCAMFGNRAQSIAPYLTKGTKVYVEGKLRWSQWERDGQKRSKVEVVVDEIEFGQRQGAQDAQGGRVYGQGGGYSPQQQSAPQGAPQRPQPYAGTQYAEASVYDQDIPF